MYYCKYDDYYDIHSKCFFRWTSAFIRYWYYSLNCFEALIYFAINGFMGFKKLFYCSPFVTYYTVDEMTGKYKQSENDYDKKKPLVSMVGNICNEIRESR